MAALEPASAPQTPGAHACGAARPALELTHRRNLSRLSKRFLLGYGNRQARWAPPAEPVICFPGWRMRYQIRISRGDIFVGGTYEDDLSMGMFFGIMPHRTEMFADFFRAWGAL